MDEKRLKGLAAQLAVVIYCLLLFQCTYPLTAAYVSNLPAVPSLVFDFERHIPFLPWMILPYMSSGLFFCIVPFYCPPGAPLLLYAKRFTFVTLIAALCFLIFPLRFSFDRPIVENPFFTYFFTFLQKYDSPFNQAPSLHVAYACLFWSVLRWQTRGWKKISVGIWILLMAIGTLTVYQHHLIDVLTALILVQVSFIIFPLNGTSAQNRQAQWALQCGQSGNYKQYAKNGEYKCHKTSVHPGTCDSNILPIRNIAVANYYYLMGWICILLTLLCERSMLAAVVFTWIALVCFAIGYHYLRGHRFFLKDGTGKISTVKKVCYAPYQLAYWLIWRFFRKKNNPSLMELLPRCYVGPRLQDSQLKAMKLGPNLVVFDLAAELEEVNLLRGMDKYYSFPLLDIAEIQLQDAQVITDALVSTYRALNKDESMIIHCTMGYSRSMVFAVLMIQQLLSLDLNEAIDRVKSINKHVTIHQHMIGLMKIIIKSRA